MRDILKHVLYRGVVIPVLMVFLAALSFLTMLYAAPYILGPAKLKWYVRSVEALDGYISHLYEVIAL